MDMEQTDEVYDELIGLASSLDDHVSALDVATKLRELAQQLDPSGVLGERPGSEGEELPHSPEYFAAMWNALTYSQRANLVTNLRDNNERATACFIQDHDRLLKELQRMSDLYFENRQASLTNARLARELIQELMAKPGWEDVPKDDQGFPRLHLTDVVRREIARLESLIPETPTEKEILSERSRQIAKGYDAAHDDEHGLDHLLLWAQRYGMEGKHLESLALVQAAREYLPRHQPSQPTEQ